MVPILINTAFRGTALIREEVLIGGRCLFQCGYPKVRHLVEGGAYLRPGAYTIYLCNNDHPYYMPKLEVSDILFLRKAS